MVDDVVSCGVMPDADIPIVGLSGPQYSSNPAPEDVVPMPMYVSVSDGVPVLVGKVMFAVGFTVLLVTVQPAEVRVTATREYAPYAASEVLCVDEAFNVPVCKLTYRFVSAPAVTF